MRSDYLSRTVASMTPTPGLHPESHPLAGQTVTIREGVEDRRGMVVPGATYRVEDYWDRLTGGSWMHAEGNPTALQYAMRIGTATRPAPLDDEVLYGKIGPLGYLVHVSEIKTP